MYKANNNKFKTVDGVYCKTAQYKIAYKETFRIKEIVPFAIKITL